VSQPRRYYITTAIDYPNSLPHIGTAFEKLGADVQARYRRLEGYDVFFLMGNDENTVKVSRRAQELGKDTQAYCDEMAAGFQAVWRALGISHDDFIQTSEPRHHAGCRAFIQKVFDNGHIYKGHYEGWYCDGCEAFKTDKEIGEAKVCPIHQKPVVLRKEPCYYFRLSAFRDRLLEFYAQHPDFIQPESRRNEVVAFVERELLDVNITRSGEDWGIRVPFDEAFTIYVWFDALLNYVTGVGYGTDEARFNQWWPADVHVIGKDITRFHCALWPAMCFAAGIAPPRLVFGHGFVSIRGEKIGKSTGNAIEPMELIEKFNAEAFRYYFLRDCPFPGDGEFSWERFTDRYNADLANNLGNLFSRTVKLVSQNENATLPGTAGVVPTPVPSVVPLAKIVADVRGHIEAFRYSQALEAIWMQVLYPANQYFDRTEPWKLVKTDAAAARKVLFEQVEQLRVIAILLKPFLPATAETIYRGFNHSQPWEQVSYGSILDRPAQTEDVRVTAPLENGKVKPLFDRLREEGAKK